MITDNLLSTPYSHSHSLLYLEYYYEIQGGQNSYTTEFRQYDPRLGRWKSLDPLMMMFPNLSPYVGFDNNPIYYVDPYGLSSQGSPGGPPDKGGDYSIYNVSEGHCDDCRDDSRLNDMLPSQDAEIGYKFSIRIEPKSGTYKEGDLQRITYVYKGKNKWKKYESFKGVGSHRETMVTSTGTTKKNFEEYMEPEYEKGSGVLRSSDRNVKNTQHKVVITKSKEQKVDQPPSGVDQFDANLEAMDKSLTWLKENAPTPATITGVVAKNTEELSNSLTTPPKLKSKSLTSTGQFNKLAQTKIAKGFGAVAKKIGPAASLVSATANFKDAWDKWDNNRLGATWSITKGVVDLLLIGARATPGGFVLNMGWAIIGSIW